MSDTLTRDNLIAGDYPIVRKAVTLLAGAGALVRGQVLGAINLAIAAAVAGTNQGNGTCASHALRAGAKVGTYTVTCITKTTAAVFSVIDPEGFRCKDALAGTPYTGPIGFSITQGNTVFEVGDSFTLVVSVPATIKHSKALASAVNGSQAVDCILLEAVTVGDSDVVAIAAFAGEFNERAVTFTSPDTAATHRAAMRARGLHLASSVAA